MNFRNLELSIVHKTLSNEDNEFIQYITSDIFFFKEEKCNGTKYSVLLFPPVTNFHRLLIHKVVESIPGLCSFSVGQEEERRTVVCSEEVLIKHVSKISPHILPKIGERGKSMSKKGSQPISFRETKMKRPEQKLYVPRKRCDVVLEAQNKTTNGHEKQDHNKAGGSPLLRCGKDKKEREIYVPIGRRILNGKKLLQEQVKTTVDSPSNPGDVPKRRNQDKEQESARGNHRSNENRDKKGKNNSFNLSSKLEGVIDNRCEVWARGASLESVSAINNNDIALMDIDNHGLMVENTEDVPLLCNNKEGIEIVCTNNENITLICTDTENISAAYKTNNSTEFVSTPIEALQGASEKHSTNESDYALDKELAVPCLEENNISVSSTVNEGVSLLCTSIAVELPQFSDIEEKDDATSCLNIGKPSVGTLVDKHGTSSSCKHKCDMLLQHIQIETKSETEGLVEEDVFLSCSDNISTLLKYTDGTESYSSTSECKEDMSTAGIHPAAAEYHDVNSTVGHPLPPPVAKLEAAMSEICEDTVTVGEKGSQSGNTFHTASEEADVPVTLIRGESPDLEEGEVMDSWEENFTEDGDRIDDDIMRELTIAVGDVMVEKPQFDYSNYQPKGPALNFAELGHVIEMYDFPAEFSTSDLMQALTHFPWHKDFTIKWVDDTHALAVFCDCKISEDALSVSHPLIKFRSLSNATLASKKKAKYAAEFVQPYKPRPETTAMAMRNMVSGALGIRPKVSKEQRDREKRQLEEARDKRRQLKQQKSDLWGDD